MTINVYPTLPLHKYLMDSELPSVLLGRLKFGNREQIDALGYLEALIRKKEAEDTLGEAEDILDEVYRPNDTIR